MSLELRLELLSDAAPGSGAGGPQVDREIVTDGAGLPVLPGRRLKGLLREAAQEVTEALALAGQARWLERELCPVGTVFGTPAQMGLVQIGDARLSGTAGEGPASTHAAQELAEWVTWAQDTGAFGASAVLASLTVIRRQTAIDPHTGAARENALRNTRTLRRGLRFAGPVALVAPEQKLHIPARRTLALAAAALRQLGTSRHRGAGRVRVVLWDSHEHDLTERHLRELETLGSREQGR